MSPRAHNLPTHCGWLVYLHGSLLTPFLPTTLFTSCYLFPVLPTFYRTPLHTVTRLLILLFPLHIAIYRLDYITFTCPTNTPPFRRFFTGSHTVLLLLPHFFVGTTTHTHFTTFGYTRLRLDRFYTPLLQFTPLPHLLLFTITRLDFVRSPFTTLGSYGLHTHTTLRFPIFYTRRLPFTTRLRLPPPYMRLFPLLRFTRTYLLQCPTARDYPTTTHHISFFTLPCRTCPGYHTCYLITDATPDTGPDHTTTHGLGPYYHGWFDPLTPLLVGSVSLFSQLFPP